MVAQFPSRSIRVSAADRLPTKPLFIGVDVSKAWVDIADTDGRRRQVANEASAIAAAFTGPWSTCANLVCEATGGYERVLMRVAAKLALPLRRVHPNRARAFAQATGRRGLRPTSSMRKCSPNWPLSPFMSRQSRRPARRPRNWPPWSAASIS